jgi:hypothetical protein
LDDIFNMTGLTKISLMTLAVVSLATAEAAEIPTDSQVCAAGIAVMMGRVAKTVRIDKSDGQVFYLSYVRPNDGTVWRYKCQIEGERVMWGSDNGRWRRDELDEVITYTKAKGKLKIVVKGLGGENRVTKELSLAQLPKM